MKLLDSIRGVLWARRRQPQDVQYWVALGHERFAPAELVTQAKLAEDAGFEGIACSDHLAPWWAPQLAPTSSGNAWVWLGAAANATRRAAIGTGVTALVHRYNPVVVAQQVATLEALAPGRAFLAVGSGEAMNEVPAGMEWPSVAEQLERTEEALEIVTRLLDGETVDVAGRHFRARAAKLHFRPGRRPPVYMSAFGPEAAEVAGRLADGIWTLGDPQQAPQVIEAYRRAAEKAGRTPGEVILQTLFSWAPDDDRALENARAWKGTLVDAHYTDDVHDPAEIQRNGEEQVSDEKLKAMASISSDPPTHVKNLKLLRELGATVVVGMNCSGGDADEALRVFGREVLPQLRS